MPELITGLTKIASVFALAFFSFWPAIPAGLALGLQPGLVIATTTLSYSAGVLLVLLPGARMRAWLTRRYARQTPPENGLVRRVWQRYGLAGLGMVGPMTVGAQIGAALALSLNASPLRLMLWMSAGALVWSIALTVLAELTVF